MKWLIAMLVFLLVAALALACEEEEAAVATPSPAITVTATPQATPSGEATPTPEATPEGRTPTAAASPTAKINWCDLITPEEADEALGEFVSATASVNGYCNWQTDSGIYLRIEPGSPEDLQARAEMEGVEGEPVPGVGEGAAWFGGVQVPSHHWDFEEEEIVTLGVLSLRQGDVYFRIMLNLPEVDSANQLEIAKGLAAKAIERLP